MSRTVRYNIEVKDSVVTATAYDESGEYVSKITCNDSDLDSVIRATKKAIIHAGENMKVSWPKYGDVYYTPDFARDSLTCAERWTGWGCEHNFKKRNLGFRTEEEAVTAARKMLETVSEQKKGQHNGQ